MCFLWVLRLLYHFLSHSMTILPCFGQEFVLFAPHDISKPNIAYPFILRYRNSWFAYKLGIPEEDIFLLENRVTVVAMQNSTFCCSAFSRRIQRPSRPLALPALPFSMLGWRRIHPVHMLVNTLHSRYIMESILGVHSFSYTDTDRPPKLHNGWMSKVALASHATTRVYV